ncbi:diguanylate cyclase domain-containing protein [Butyrivibrio sp. XPD2002]|uniref:diguanylate cyclase domain-containing protein n=1 Tax=Butyrivibrio sp. XPD2002 TaxID=1280665 RepID=UPI00047B1E16|nr:diguanylate cyclase [Butyrivibrio sp. XPD2002]
MKKALTLNKNLIGICGYLMAVVALYALLLKDRINIGSYIMLRTLLMSVLIVNFIIWWKKDYKAKERDRFINRAIQYAVASNSPEENINSMIRFLGKELSAMRIFIFEDQKNGKYRGTYEWFDEELEATSLELMYVPYDGFIDKILEAFEDNNNRLIIGSAESCKTSIPSLYDFIKTNDIDNVVLGPLEFRGTTFGVCGVTDVPKNQLEDVAEIIRLISYFIAQLIMQREEQKRSFFYSYNDTLTGAYNNIAYKKYIEKDLDKGQPFGFLRCDLIGLMEINVSQGYEVGDMIVIILAKALMEVFGENNVYRMNGTEFVAFGFETDEVFFNTDVERVKKLISEKGINVAFAPVYCMYGTSDMSIVVKRAENLMHENFEKMMMK